MPDNDLQEVVIRQLSPEAVFKARGSAQLRCSNCGGILVEQYEPRQLPGISIACFTCGCITSTDEWPADEPLPPGVVNLGESGAMGLRGPLEIPQSVCVTTGRQIARVKLQAPRDPGGRFELEPEQLRAFEVETNILTGGAFGRALGVAQSAHRQGNRRFMNSPLAWAMLELRRQLGTGTLDLTGDGAYALSYFHWVLDAIERWRHHPLFHQLAPSIVHDFHHALTTFVSASYLSQHGNRIGFTDTPKQAGRSPDMYINFSPVGKFSIEVKAPESFRWPASMPSRSAAIKVIETQIRSAKGQLTGVSGGVVVLGAFHDSPEFEQTLNDVLSHVVTHKTVSKRIAGVAIVSFRTARPMTDHASGDVRFSAVSRVLVEKNPRYNGVVNMETSR